MIKTGIFFGGPSREREISFAGGRTVYDNLDKSLFEPVPIFVDSNRRLVLLDWPYIYKGTIRDFFPPVSHLPPSANRFQIYLESMGALDPQAYDKLLREVGRPIALDELPNLIDVAFLALHGEYGEDGQIQGLLDSLRIPYTGSGIRASSIGIDKGFQKKLMAAAGFPCPEVRAISRREWRQADAAELYRQWGKDLGFPLVIRPANQGSSIGVTILEADKGLEGFVLAMDRAFFRQTLSADDWQGKTREAKIQFLRELTDIRDNLGFPLEAHGQTFFHPEELLLWLDGQTSGTITLESHLLEQEVIAEAFIRGKEFSCIVIRLENGTGVALPPTEIIKSGTVFDYRAKYLPGMARKQTPIQLPDAEIQAIRREAERLFEYLGFQTYARIDGFITPEGTIFLNDPNTTSGMLPSSFFFHQAAEIGLNPSQFLTYILRISIQERLAQSKELPPYRHLIDRLDQSLAQMRSQAKRKKRIAVILGGYSFERHISVESGRNIFEKLSSSEKYEPLPIFLKKEGEGHALYQIPVNLLLKDNADDIRDKIEHYQRHPLIQNIIEECREVTGKYASAHVVFEPRRLSYEELAREADGAFIALHGRPGEDGEVQRNLERVGLPYNGSGPQSSGITINKYETLRILRDNGFLTAQQMLAQKSDWQTAPGQLVEKIELDFSYPLIAKPVDDGCSSAVKVIRNREQLEAYLRLLFREAGEEGLSDRQILGILPYDEVPFKGEVLIETLITAGDAIHFLEITGGLLTHYEGDRVDYEVFEPSEALASGEILSLEEKFLAGEGQNITPARFAQNPQDYTYIANQVKADLERAARILGVKGYARIDAFVRIFADGRAETIIIEVNSLPGMTPATCIYHQAALNGYKPYAFIDKILEFGFHERKVHPVVE